MEAPHGNKPGKHARERIGPTRAAGTVLGALAAAAVAAGAVAADCSRIDDPLQLLEIQIEIDPRDWDAILLEPPVLGQGEKPATFLCENEGLIPVLVSRKPGPPHPFKPSLKIDFDDRVPEGEWHGLRKLNLENGGAGELLREGLAWQLMARAGVIASGSSWARLHVNGRPAGIYTLVEQVDKSFLRRHVGDDEGFLYDFKLQVTRQGESDPFAGALCYQPFDVQCEPPPEVHASLARHLDVEQFLTLAAANAFIGNPDGPLGNDFNYFMYSWSRPRLYFPWDLDRATFALPGTDAHRVGDGISNFQLFLLGDPLLRDRFDRILIRLLGSAFHRENVDALLAEVAAAVGPAIEADPGNALEEGFARELERVRSWYRTRIASLSLQLPPAEKESLVINEVLAANGGGIRDEGGESADWVEILHRGDAPLSLRGFFLSDDPAQPRLWPLPERDLVPGERLLIWCDGDTREGPLHAAFRLDAGGEGVGLYAATDLDYRTVDFIRFGPQGRDVSLGRFPDGAPAVRRLRCPTPAAANRESCAPAGAFRRGDVAADGVLDLTDAIRLLSGLFGGLALECARAADSNDDGKVNLTDAVAILLHLFQSGAPPPPPFAACGVDATGDALDCESYPACP